MSATLGGTTVHATAVVDPKARIGRGVEVGPFAVIGPDVAVGDGCRIGPHCVLDGHLTLGEGNLLTSHVALGGPPQDLKYAGEPTRLVVGARNQFREFVTINRGTSGGGGTTTIGDENLFMTHAHVAHDCSVGSRTVFANQATLAGHVQVGDFATVGAFTALHQFCRVGRHAFIGGYTVATQDVLPFMRTVGARGGVRCYGPNRIGLQRKGVAPGVVEALERAFRVLRAPGGRTALGLARVRAVAPDCAEVVELADFLDAARASRGFHL